MNTIELNQALYCLPHFVGTFPCDSIPLVALRPCSYVINLDGSEERGSHWVSLFVDQFNNATYFDSYGQPPPDGNDICDILPCFTSNPLIFNNKILQSIESDVCGYYCALFIILFGNGVPLVKIQSLFSDDFKLNDRLVKKLVQNYIVRVLEQSHANHLL